MFENILGMVHYSVILLFGIFLTAAFLGIRRNRKNIWKLLCIAGVLGIINGVCFAVWGEEVTEGIYPFIIHLPLIFCFKLVYRCKLVSSALAVFVSYMCCQISNWIGLFFLNITQQQWVYYIVRIVVNIGALILLVVYASTAVAELLKKTTKDIIIFGLIPFVYYLYDYAVTVYTKLFYSAGAVVTEFLGFMLCVFYVLFLVIYFKQYEERMKAEQQNKIMELQCVQAERQVEVMKRSEYAVSILRHDMRHFLSDIAGFVENGEQERTLNYIHDVIAAVDHTIAKKYCGNKIVNMIVSSFEERFAKQDIVFHCDIQIPETLAIADSDISAILSNALENAVHAVLKLEPQHRRIELGMHSYNNKLLISIKNTYGEKPEFVDGLPQAKEDGHGFGVQSIRYVTERRKGNCQFTADEEYFILQIVL